MPQMFNPGDTVQLKSGGPKMTVVKFGRYRAGTVEGYCCRWFDEKNKLVESVFTEAELQAAATSPGVRTRYAVASKGL